MKAIFELERSDGNASTGSKREIAIERADLVFEVTKARLKKMGKDSHADLRLDAPINLFLKAVGASVDDVYRYMTDETRYLFEFVSDYWISKSELMPSKAVARNSELAELILDLPSHFSLLRYSTDRASDFPMVEEKLTIETNGVPKLRYVDCSGEMFSGVLFVGKDKLTATVYSDNSSYDALDFCSITIYLNRAIDDNYCIFLQRSLAGEARTDVFRCVGLPRDDEFEVSEIGPIDGRQIKYLKALSNDTKSYNGATTSFSVGVDLTRSGILNTLAIFNQYVSENSNYRTIASTSELVDKLEKDVGTVTE